MTNVRPWWKEILFGLLVVLVAAVVIPIYVAIFLPPRVLRGLGRRGFKHMDARNQGKAEADDRKPPDWMTTDRREKLEICDRCGVKIRSFDMLVKHGGLFLCRDCGEKAKGEARNESN